MIRWIISAALCLFLTEASHPALAQKAEGADGGPAAVSSSRVPSPAAVKGGSGSSGRTTGLSSGSKGSKPRAAAKPAPSRSGGGVKNNSKAKSDSGRGGNLAPVAPGRHGSISSGAKKPARPGPDDKPGQPGPDDKPGRPGDRPGIWGHSGKPHRPFRDRCDPYCYGPTWYGYYNDDLKKEEPRRPEPAPEPLTYFSPGQFEFFADPRLDWAAEGGLGSVPASPPPPGAKPFSPADKAQSEAELRQYEQMMKSWR